MMTAIQNRAATTRAQSPIKNDAPQEREDFITKDEVAKRLKKSERTIENWQRRGYIPFTKAGHAVLYKWSEVEAHLQKHFHICHLN